jgi:sugar O-acyltransferase (sialic acid O-acetyltransferase NeuD family)
MSHDKYTLAITPQLGVNDQVAVITDWYVKDGQEVGRGELICCLETTKASMDVEAEHEGVFKIFVQSQESVDINQPLGAFFLDYAAYEELGAGLAEQYAKKPVAAAPVATAKAVRLAQELGVDLADITVSGVIREKDVQEYAQTHGAEAVREMALELHPERKNVAVYGSGRGAYTIKENLSLRGEYHVVCYLDDDKSKVGVKDGVPVLHGSFLEGVAVPRGLCVALGIADASARRRILVRCRALGLEVINVIHPEAWLSPSVKLGCGNHIKAGAVIDTSSEIGDACIIDNNTTIAHDNVIESFSHLAPGVALGSSITIGEGTIVGIGASVSTGVKIGAHCIISVGSAVTKNVEAGMIVEGVPARVVGQRRSAD